MWWIHEWACNFHNAVVERVGDHDLIMMGRCDIPGRVEFSQTGHQVPKKYGMLETIAVLCRQNYRVY